jgi:hypothetical protein
VCLRSFPARGVEYIDRTIIERNYDKAQALEQGADEGAGLRGDQIWSDQRNRSGDRGEDDVRVRRVHLRNRLNWWDGTTKAGWTAHHHPAANKVSCADMPPSALRSVDWRLQTIVVMVGQGCAKAFVA